MNFAKHSRHLCSAAAFLTLLFMLAPVHAGTPLHEGLLSYWALNEDQGSVANDAGPAGATVDNGQLRNAPTWINGIFGAGVQFNGTTQDVLLPTSTDLNIGTNAVTLSAWVKLDQLPTAQSGAFAGIFDSTGDNYVFYVDKTNDELRFKVTTASGAAERPGVPGSMLNTSNWLHVMGVYDGAGRAMMYFNGALVDTHSAAGLTGLVHSGQRASIGAQPAETGSFVSSNFFKGGIADVAVWNRPLGAAEAQYLYNGGVGNAVGAANPIVEPIVVTPPVNRPIIVAAHRGNSLAAPENTLSAFAASKDLAERVEFDVQVSKDGKLVVMHDGSVDRTTNGTGSVGNLNYAGYIDGLDAGSWFSPAFNGEPVPTMRQSIDAIFADGMVPLIERKSGSAAAYVNELTQMGILDDVVIIAFDWNFLAQVRALAPNVQLGALGSGTLNASVINSIAAVGANFVNWGDGAAVNPANIDLARAAGMEFHVWTVNNSGRMQQLIDMGVDGITTDDPAALRALTPWPAEADFNRDGFVNGADLDLWKAGFGQTGATQTDGDANDDGVVDGADFLVWQRQFSSGPATAATGVVPEPSAAALAWLAGTSLVAMRRRRFEATRSIKYLSRIYG